MQRSRVMCGEDDKQEERTGQYGVGKSACDRRVETSEAMESKWTGEN